MEEYLGYDQVPAKRVRRSYSKQFKQSLVDEVNEGKLSIAKIALAHQINANLLHKWVVNARASDPPLSFVPVAVNAGSDNSADEAFSYELTTAWGTLQFSQRWDPVSVALLIKSLT